MTYQTMAPIFMSIAQTRRWGYLDELNRISIKVLSVFSTQSKCIFDGFQTGVAQVFFMEGETKLISICGGFITKMGCRAGRGSQGLDSLGRYDCVRIPLRI